MGVQRGRDLEGESDRFRISEKLLKELVKQCRPPGN
jgi:hypothetical protein